MGGQLKLRVDGLSRLDQLELQRELDPAVLSFEQAQAEGGEHGELLTATAVIVVGIAALRMLAACLLRARRTRKINETLEVELPDGTKVKRQLKIDLSEADQPDAALVKAIVDLFPTELATLAAG